MFGVGMISCPYNFLNDFDRWWRWHVCVEHDKLSPQQATENVIMHDAGWRLIEGHKHGGWTYPNAHKNSVMTMHAVEIEYEQR